MDLHFLNKKINLSNAHCPRNNPRAPWSSRRRYLFNRISLTQFKRSLDCVTIVVIPVISFHFCWQSKYIILRWSIVCELPFFLVSSFSSTNRHNEGKIFDAIFHSIDTWYLKQKNQQWCAGKNQHVNLSSPLFLQRKREKEGEKKNFLLDVIFKVWRKTGKKTRFHAKRRFWRIDKEDKATRQTTKRKWFVCCLPLHLQHSK